MLRKSISKQKNEKRGLAIRIWSMKLPTLYQEGEVSGRIYPILKGFRRVREAEAR